MLRPAPTLAPLSVSLGSMEPSSERFTSAGSKREREAQGHANDIATRGGLCKDAAGPLPALHHGPLVAIQQTHLRDRDIGPRRVAAQSQAVAPAATRIAFDATRPPHQQMEAASRFGPRHLPITPGNGEMENLSGNRFGGNELCPSCAQPHADANYVATDADGVSRCGDCWDAALGVNIITQCVFRPGIHLCDCGKDLRMEQWFAVERTPEQQAFCKACSLTFWGFNNADMVVSAIKDGRLQHLEQEGGAHLLLRLTTPNDDTSPSAALSDRGFSTGQVPSLLESCMNLSPQPGEQTLITVHARARHARDAHTGTRAMHRTRVHTHHCAPNAATRGVDY